ncbi:MAG: flagellar biosynthesis protein FlhF [Ignavibacteriales bacterium]|nr:flagellar biosynthesis protein FlhF [Ignavibacteriales bacterium]
MQIKKYLAPTLKEALEQLKNELGDDAVVLSTRVVTSNTNTGTKKQYEVVAGTESNRPKETAHPKLVDTIIDDNPKNTIEELQRLKDKVFPHHEKPKKEIKIENLKSERIKNAVTPAKLKEIKEDLLVKEIFPSVVNKIVDQLSQQSDFIKSGNIDENIVSTIASLVRSANFEVKKSKEPKVVSLVGSTGVGKTTCIAKLAVISKIFHMLDIGIITIDTFRLGAIDQLKIFAEISNVELLVCYEPTDLKKLVNKFKKKDLIFIDTAGRSQNNTASINEMKKFLSSIEIDETFLVLSSTASTRNLLDVIKKFQPLNFTGLIFTKLDESAAFGNILNVSSKVETPIKFLTNGQVIPDDIIAADSDFIAKMIFTGNIK